MEEKIKAYLKEHGITQRYVAGKIGMKETTLSACLTGQARLRAETLFLICDVLGVNPEVFAPDKE